METLTMTEEEAWKYYDEANEAIAAKIRVRYYYNKNNIVQAVVDEIKKEPFPPVCGL